MSQPRKRNCLQLSNLWLRKVIFDPSVHFVEQRREVYDTCKKREYLEYLAGAEARGDQTTQDQTSGLEGGHDRDATEGKTRGDSGGGTRQDNESGRKRK